MRRKSLLYNFYDAGSLLGQAGIRKGMDDLLSKHADQVSFEMYYSFYSRVQETWKRIGIETLPIDGRYVRTVKFERTSTRYPDHHRRGEYFDGSVWHL